MNLLAATLYDPSTAASKATTSALAMTALDTTNLRLTFTVPLSGQALVRVRGGVLHGATTFPNILLGVMNGAAVTARVAPKVIIAGTALATTFGVIETDFVVTGLTPGASLTWDLAYGVETLVASTGLKYGGPNNTTANDAFGGISYEIHDPSPIYLPAAMPTSTVAARVAGLTYTTANKVDSTIQAAADLAQAAADKVWSTTTRTLSAFGFTVTVGTNNDKTGYALSAAGVQAVWDALTSALTTVGSIGKRIADFLTGDAFVRLGAPAGASVSVDVAAVKADSAAIKTQTDKLTFSVANKIDANIKNVNNIAVTGSGTTISPWGP